MFTIVGALCIFFFIVVPLVRWIGTLDFTDYRTPEQIEQSKINAKLKKIDDDIKTKEWGIKWFWVFIAGFEFIFLMAIKDSPYVSNKPSKVIISILGAIAFTLFINGIIKYQIKNLLDNRKKIQD